MKITMSWKTSYQISPDHFSTYTKVFHCDENDTLKQLHEKLTKEYKDKTFNGEIQFLEDSQ